MTKKSYSGTKTLLNGTRVPMTPQEAEAMWRAMEQAKAKLAADIPTTLDALTQINAARQRLADLGWKKSTFSIEDGTEVAVIEEGSTGIFYRVWVRPYFHYSGCVSGPKNGLYFKLLGELTQAEKERADKCAEDYRVMMDAEAKSMAAMQELMARANRGQE